MTKQLEALIAEAKLSASIMELIASFELQDIDGDDVDLRFEVDGFDTGCNVSLVEQCGKASEQLAALIAALEQVQAERDKFKFAFTEWHDKTEWVQKESTTGRFSFIPLGMHRADVMTRHIENLEASALAVKLPAELIDEVCLAAAEIHNRGNGVDDDKAQFIIDRIRNFLENGGQVEGE